MSKWSVGDRLWLEPYGEGHVTEVIGSGLFLRVQWPMFDMPQLVTTANIAHPTNKAAKVRKGK